MSAAEELRQHLRPGQVCRRAELAELSSAVDRHLRQLVDAGALRKLRAGVYYRPQKSSFGEIPADERRVVAAFLKDGDFLIVSLNAYNALGLGTTQLYNERLVYNYKRDGRFDLNGQKYYFLKNRRFPKQVTDAFLLVDLINNIELLAEDRDALKDRVAKRVHVLGADKVRRAVRAYGKVATRKYFESLFDDRAFADAG